MKKALISTFEPRNGGYRVAQVVEIGSEFPVADGLFWADCPDETVKDDWYYADNQVHPVPAPAVSVLPVSPRQIRMALTRANLRQSVESAVAAGDQDLKDWWEFSQVFERNHPQVEVMVTALGVTSEQADNLWQLAATL